MSAHHMIRSLLTVGLLLTTGVLPHVSADDTAPRTPQAPTAVPGHQTLNVEGWTVHVSDQLKLDQPVSTETALRLLEAQLKEVVRVIPVEPLARLREVPLWLSPTPAGFGPTAEYHPDAGWLRDHERDPAMAKAIQFTNIPNFPAEIKRMPVMVLHELAHAYHDRVLGFDFPEIRQAYDRAMAAGLYDKVTELASGVEKKAYAATNHKEYFAELTESYFGVNDFYPANRTQLRQHDPQMCDLLGRVWKVTTQTTPDAARDPYVVKPPPADMKLPAFYQKYVEAHGYPIVSSGRVNDYALKEAAYIVDIMLAKRPDVRKAMIDSGSRLIVEAYDEFSTDIPEYAQMTPKDYWDARARGFGGSQHDPVCSCAEENVLGYPGDPYGTESILIHEFAHNIHLRGMIRVDPEFDKRVKAAYDAAMQEKLWAGKYAAVNHHEYFAEGVQSWFNNNRSFDHDHNHVDTRAELREYDPRLAALCEEVFGDTVLEYTKPISRLTGHLAGYDPSTCPEFTWPERLQKVRSDIRKQAQDRSDKATGENTASPKKADKP
ncbi:MAG: hypothetical protein JSS02_10290 [Planctomycetes bacterium]|nr:hypothetical protein [Planctomycetota bacterium]